VVILLILLALPQLDLSVYRFEGGYVEVWYQLPVSCCVDSQHPPLPEDSLYDCYTYQFEIRNTDGTDSAVIKGTKGVISGDGNSGELLIDYIPLNLYSGRFRYALEINAISGRIHSGGAIDIAPDTAILSCSDVIIGYFGHGNFLFRDIPFLPSIGAEFTDRSSLFSYLELYGLVPDSLYYEVTYRVCDGEGALIAEQKDRLLKYDYAQIDTHSMDLLRLADGEYVYGVSVTDPSSQSSVARTVNFKVKTTGDYVKGEFHRLIQYLVSASAYRKFQNLSDIQQKVYLKEFWSKHDYAGFEKSMREADHRFSTGKLPGRDSERGRLYILLGPPDEKETIPIATWSRPFEVWRYYGERDYLFCDVMNDNNPRLIRVLKPGEIEQILQSGFRDGTREEDWLSDIAPGTYDWYEDLESIE